MRRALVLLLSTALSLPPFGASYAQNPQPAPPGTTPPRVAPPSAPNPPPEKIVPPVQTEPGNQTLSDKLSRRNGMLRPPQTLDRGAVIEPKHQGESMPVIRPPETTGGHQKIIPK